MESHFFWSSRSPNLTFHYILIQGLQFNQFFNLFKVVVQTERECSGGYILLLTLWEKKISCFCSASCRLILFFVCGFSQLHISKVTIRKMQYVHILLNIIYYIFIKCAPFSFFDFLHRLARLGEVR